MSKPTKETNPLKEVKLSGQVILQFVLPEKASTRIIDHE
jgi:hypothetical protein